MSQFRILTASEQVAGHLRDELPERVARFVAGPPADAWLVPHFHSSHS